MTDYNVVKIYGASDDLIEFDGSIDGEVSWPSAAAASIVLKSPSGVEMRLIAQFCGPRHSKGWLVCVSKNPGLWLASAYESWRDDGDYDVGMSVVVPFGTTAMCGGKPVS